MRDARAWPRRDSLARGITLVGTVACVAWAMVAADPGRLSWLFGVLALGVVGADLFGTGTGAQAVHVSGSALAAIVVLALFGPAWAFAVVVASELITWLVERYPAQRMATNVVGSGAPVLVAGTIFDALKPAEDGSAGFYLALALAAALMFALNLVIVAGITSMLEDDVPFWSTIWSALGTLLISIAINVALALAATGLCLELGLGGTAFAAFTLIAFSYMARLVSTARHRSKQYASLSWGALSGLLRTLDLRDPRAARHAAAVAAFARDISKEAGMTSEE